MQARARSRRRARSPRCGGAAGSAPRGCGRLAVEVVAHGGDQAGHRVGRGVVAGEAHPPRMAFEIGVRHGAVDLEQLRRAAVGVEVRSRSKFAGSRQMTSRSVPMCSNSIRISARRWRARLASVRSMPPRSGRCAASSLKRYSTAGTFDTKLGCASTSRRPRAISCRSTIISSRSRPSVPPSSQKRGRSAPDPPAPGQEGVQRPPLVRDAEVHAFARHRARRAARGGRRLGRDLAGEEASCPRSRS
jgi:hypothetical protein